MLDVASNARVALQGIKDFENYYNKLPLQRSLSMQAHESLRNLPMPDQRVGQLVRRVLDVNDTAMRRSRSRPGRVKQERAKGEDGAFLGEANRLRAFGAKTIDGLR